MSLGESWYGDITGRPRPRAQWSSAPGIFLPSARGENARDLSAHMKKKTFKGDCQTDHFWIAFYDTLFYRRWKSQSSNHHNPCIKSSNLQCENTQSAVIQTLPCTHSQLIRLINTLKAGICELSGMQTHLQIIHTPRNQHAWLESAPTVSMRVVCKPT